MTGDDKDEERYEAYRVLARVLGPDHASFAVADFGTPMEQAVKWEARYLREIKEDDLQ